MLTSHGFVLIVQLCLFYLAHTGTYFDTFRLFQYEYRYIIQLYIEALYLQEHVQFKYLLCRRKLSDTLRTAHSS